MTSDATDGVACDSFGIENEERSDDNLQKNDDDSETKEGQRRRQRPDEKTGSRALVIRSLKQMPRWTWRKCCQPQRRPQQEREPLVQPVAVPPDAS